MDSRKYGTNLPKILKDKRMKREKTQREKLWEEATGHCIYCGRPVSLESMEVDHIHPISLGGDNSYGNKVCTCPCCNAEKGAAPLEVYLRENMTAKQRKRFSNRVTHLAEQGKMSWSKAESLDPYMSDAFDADWDFPDEEEEVFQEEPVKCIRFQGEFFVEFR